MNIKINIKSKENDFEYLLFSLRLSKYFICYIYI